MWKILYAEDKYIWVERVKKFLQETFTKGSFELLTADAAFSGTGKIADEFLSLNNIHIAIIDSYFANENHVRINIDGYEEEYGPETLGEGLIKKYRKSSRPLCFVFLTGKRENTRKVDEAFQKFINDPKVVPIGKGRLRENERSQLIDDFRKLTKQSARQLVREGSFMSGNNGVPDYNVPLDGDMEIKLGSEDWRLESLCQGWRDEEGNINYEEAVRELFIPDLSLAFSACFNTQGIKQSTHSSGKSYFKYNNKSELKMHIEEQFNRLDKVINEINNLKDILGNSDTIANYENFKRVCLNSNFLKEGAYIENDDEIMELRNINFRYGDPPFEIKIDGRQSDCFNNISKGTRKFEISLPIHGLFKEALKRLLKKSDDRFMLLGQKWDKLVWPDQVEEGINPVCWLFDVLDG